jgi:hypothetical protein
MTSHVLVLDRPDGAVSLTTRRIDRLGARALGARLDRELAAGRPPEWSRLHAARAEQLVALPFREALAGSWERVVKSVVRRPLHRAAAVTAARAPILLLAERLRAPLPVPARGVALAQRLLTDGTGPLFSPFSSATLEGALAEAIAALDPATPLLPWLLNDEASSPRPRR